MHYSDGTQAELNDIVLVDFEFDGAGSQYIGLLVSATATSETCNGQLIPTLKRDRSTAGVSHWYTFNTPHPQCFTIKKAKKLT